jgi:hypothetical protein
MADSENKEISVVELEHEDLEAQFPNELKNLVQGEYTNDVQSYITDRRWYRTAASLSRNLGYVTHGATTVVAAYTAYSGESVYAIIATTLGVISSTFATLENKFSTEEAKSSNRLEQTLQKFGIDGKFDETEPNDNNDPTSKKGI